jgi:hypothetical protein
MAYAEWSRSDATLVSMDCAIEPVELARTMRD